MLPSVKRSWLLTGESVCHEETARGISRSSTRSRRRVLLRRHSSPLPNRHLSFEFSADSPAHSHSQQTDRPTYRRASISPQRISVCWSKNCKPSVYWNVTRIRFEPRHPFDLVSLNLRSPHCSITMERGDSNMSAALFFRCGITRSPPRSSYRLQHRRLNR